MVNSGFSGLGLFLEHWQLLCITNTYWGQELLKLWNRSELWVPSEASHPSEGSKPWGCSELRGPLAANLPANGLNKNASASSAILSSTLIHYPVPVYHSDLLMCICVCNYVWSSVAKVGKVHLCSLLCSRSVCYRKPLIYYSFYSLSFFLSSLY